MFQKNNFSIYSSAHAISPEIVQFTSIENFPIFDQQIYVKYTM